MTATWEVLDATKAGKLRDDAHEFALDVLEGLSERPKRLSSRWFYDERGSELFARIMDVPQYYLTDCEREILEQHAAAIVAPMARKPFNLVDLGAGDGRKTSLLLSHLADAGADVTYVPIDISEPAIASLVKRIRTTLPRVEVRGLVSEYANGLRWLRAQPNPRPNLVLLLGSNIGNFNKSQARAFLRRLWSALAAGDHVMVGFDLKKDIDLLLSAYNDPQGITKAFNLNLLSRINRELGGDFDVDRFRHFATYDVFSGAMESYLVSLEAQTVFIEEIGVSFEFEPWEPIHTEYSYKYLETDIDQLAAASGFTIVNKLFDRRRWFTDAVFRAEKPAHP